MLEQTESILEKRKRKQEVQKAKLEQLELQREALQHDVAAQVIYSPCYTILKSDGIRRRLLHNLKISGANKGI